MIEQLLLFFAMLLGLDIQQPDIEYYGSGVVVETGVNYEIDIQEIQNSVIVEDYFLFLERLGRINYARGCAGEATPPTRNGERWIRCGMRSFDCGGMMKYYGWIKGIITKEQIPHLNSLGLYELGEKKDPRLAKRGDFMYWVANSSGSDATHFAVVYSGYDKINHTLTIMDNFVMGRPGQIGIRELKVYCNNTRCMYMGKYKIYISTNGMIEEAKKKGVLVNAFKILDE